MPPRCLVAFALLALCACRPAEVSRAQAVVGAVLLDGNGGPPLTDSAVVVVGSRIQAVGRRTETLIPPDTNIVDGAGKFLLPALVDAGAARLGHVATLAEARSLVAGGGAGFIGMIRDTEELSPEFVSQLRDLRIVVAPSLVSAGAALKIAQHNTQRLFAAGVLIAVAAGPDGFLREAELLVETGIPPLDVIVAATRNGAIARGEFSGRGSIQPGKRADLLLVSANPGEDIRNLGKVARRMENGAWQ